MDLDDQVIQTRFTRPISATLAFRAAQELCPRTSRSLPEVPRSWLRGNLEVSNNFLLSWSPVFKGTAQGFLVALFGWPIPLYKKAKGWRDTGKKFYRTGKKVYAFFTDPKFSEAILAMCKNRHFLPSGTGKLYRVQTRVALVLGHGIAWVQNVSDMIKIDLLTLARLTCVWATFGYENKFYVIMILPIVVDVSNTLATH